MNVNVNGSRPACLYNDPSVFVKTEFDTGTVTFVKCCLNVRRDYFFCKMLRVTFNFVKCCEGLHIE